MEVERERALQRMLRKPSEETANNFGVEPVPQGGDIAPARVWDLADIVELVPPSDTGKARDAVGAQLGVSGGTGSG